MHLPYFGCSTEALFYIMGENKNKAGLDAFAIHSFPDMH
jgi:hypothetical protein